MSTRQTMWLSGVLVAVFAASALAQPEPPQGQRRGGPGDQGRPDAAQGRGGRGRGAGPQGPPPQGQRRGGPGDQGPPGLAQLDEKQREALRALREKFPEQQQSADKMRQLQGQLDELLRADTLDAAKIESVKKETVAAQTNALNTRINRQLELAKILTPAQRRSMGGRGGVMGRGQGRGGPGPMGPGQMGPGMRGPGPGPGGGRRFMGPGGGRGFGPMRRRMMRQMMRRGPGGRGGRGFMRPFGPWGPGREEPPQ